MASLWNNRLCCEIVTVAISWHIDIKCCLCVTVCCFVFSVQAREYLWHHISTSRYNETIFCHFHFTATKIQFLYVAVWFHSLKQMFLFIYYLFMYILYSIHCVLLFSFTIWLHNRKRQHIKPIHTYATQLELELRCINIWFLCTCLFCFVLFFSFFHL